MANKQHEDDHDDASPEEGTGATSGESSELEARGDGASEERDSAPPEAPSIPSAARAEDEPEDADPAASQLGIRRYVMAGYFAAGMMLAYVLSRTFTSIWATVANREWFAQAVPALAAVPDDSKATYATVLAAVISLFVIFRLYRRPDMRTWSDDVATELAKCVWPNKREVTNYTTVVIVVSLLCTAYLAILDRFYAFVTNLVYANGS